MVSLWVQVLLRSEQWVNLQREELVCLDLILAGVVDVDGLVGWAADWMSQLNHFALMFVERRHECGAGGAELRPLSLAQAWTLSNPPHCFFQTLCKFYA